MLVNLILIAHVLKIVVSMNPNPQPCVICGGSVARIWSFHSHVGDRYLRINPNVSTTTSGMKVDLGGIVNIDGSVSSVDALVQFKDESAGFPTVETRIKFTFYHNNVKYYLQALGVNDELHAINATTSQNIADFSDVFAPIRLTSEHDLFYVFESVKHRNYYLGATGTGNTKLVNVHSEPYRDSETLFKLVDPGNEIASASFGSTVSARRKKRHALARRSMRREIVELFPGRVYGKREKNRKRRKTKMSSLRAAVQVPVLTAFTLCFWIRTKDETAQIFSMVYNNKKKPRINVSIEKGILVLHLDGRKRRIRKCTISDGKWHHVCVSLQNTSRLFIHRDGKNVHQFRFRFSKASQAKLNKAESAVVYLGRRGGTSETLSLTGDLSQVNIWDSFPLFRISRIATNSACGGGNIVDWKDILATTSLQDVELYRCDDCPTRVGFTFDKRRQNNLV